MIVIGIIEILKKTRASSTHSFSNGVNKFLKTLIFIPNSNSGIMVLKDKILKKVVALYKAAPNSMLSVDTKPS